MEILKDYNVTIQYHLRMANVVKDALSEKTIIMDSLACSKMIRRPLAR